MFESMTVKTLKQLVSQYRQHHNIKGYSKMKKAELLTELDKRFVIRNNELYLRQTTPTPTATPQKQKKRITPVMVTNATPQHKSFETPRSNALKRVLKKADDLEEYYRNRAGRDEYPSLAF